MSRPSYAQVAGYVPSTTTTSDIVDVIDWERIPTTQEVKELIAQKMFNVGSDDLDNPTMEAFHFIDDLYKQDEKIRIQTIPLQTIQHYTFPSIAEGQTRLAETKIQHIRTNEMQTHQETELKTWQLLIDQLDPSEWIDLWKHLPFSRLYETNWTIHLLKEQQQQKNNTNINESSGQSTNSPSYFWSLLGY